MKLKQNEQGFTLIELLLVVVIIGILLAVIVPRAWRANVDAKYGMVRQNASELASIGSQWAHNQLESQDIVGSTAQLADYLAFIAGGVANASTVAANSSNQWVASATAAGWKVVNAPTFAAPAIRNVGGTAVQPSGPAMELMAIDRRARNPFNGQDVFNAVNVPASASPLPGAIASGVAADKELGDDWYYFGLRFQGTDNSAAGNEDPNTAGSFHADMNGIDLNHLRAGVFMARALRTP